jgi:predicted nucleotide-binding protein
MARRRSREPEGIEIRQFNSAEIDRAVGKLRRRLDDTNGLDPQQIRFDDAKVENVERNIRETVREIFGTNSPEFNDHGNHTIWHGGYNYLDTESQLQAKFAAGIPQTITMLEGLISRLEEKRDDLPLNNTDNGSAAKHKFGSRRVFVVHGHDEAAKEAVARFLAKLHLEPVILHEQPNQGRTIIEKFEENAAVDFAVILLTPDDSGHPSGSPEHSKSRARQNVVFELGYFVGRLGRTRVCALHKGSIEIPSDYGGVVYVPMDDAQGWHLLLAREIKAAGIEVDLNLAL